MVTPTVTLEATLGVSINDVAGNAINDITGDPILDMGLADIIADTRTDAPMIINQGIRGTGALDRVADIGEITFRLHNANKQYSPDAVASVRDRFRMGIDVRLGISSAGNTSYTRGKVGYIEPDSSTFGRVGTEIVANDWMKEAAEVHPGRMQVQLAKRDDQLLTTLLAAMPLTPLTQSLATGPETYAYAFHNFKDEDAYAIGVMQSISQSGLSYMYVQSDATYGQTFVYEGRDTRENKANDPPSLTLSDSMSGVRVFHDENKRVRKVTIHVVPTRVDPAATTVLYSIDNEITLNSGASKTFVAYYRDPDEEATRVAGLSMVTPVVDTDYKFSSVSGSGNDFNADLEVLIGDAGEFGGNSAVVTVTNNNVATGYLHFFRLRGKGVYQYDISSKSVEDTTQTRGVELDFTLVYNGDLDAAAIFAQLLLDQWKDDQPFLDGVEFVANRSADLMEAAITGDIGDLVTIKETQTGVSGNFFIQHRNITISQKSEHVLVRWQLIPASTASLFEAWILDSATRSQLDSTTILGL
ncbi:MAG TPA: hypothetical protein ENI05_08570 [Porticoccus sp.]|nr:hypothetical protein [Porticoccus sp.]